MPVRLRLRVFRLELRNLKGKVAWVVGNGNCISMSLDAGVPANNFCVPRLTEV